MQCIRCKNLITEQYHVHPKLQKPLCSKCSLTVQKQGVGVVMPAVKTTKETTPVVGWVTVVWVTVVWVTVVWITVVWVTVVWVTVRLTVGAMLEVLAEHAAVGHRS